MTVIIIASVVGLAVLAAVGLAIALAVAEISWRRRRSRRRQRIAARYGDRGLYVASGAGRPRRPRRIQMRQSDFRPYGQQERI